MNLARTAFEAAAGPCFGIALVSLMAPHGALAGPIQTTNSVYQLDSSQPGLPSYTSSVSVPAIETINPNQLPSDTTFSYTPSPTGTDNPAVVTGSLPSHYAAPYAENGQLITSPYFSAGLGKITFDFSNEKTYFGLLWGSVDTYNDLIFNNVTKVNGVITTVQVADVTGSTVYSNPQGNQALGGAVWLNMNFLNGNQFNEVVFSDKSSVSFEFASVSTNVVNTPIQGPFSEPGIATPEPSTVVLFAAGLAGVAFAARRRRTTLQ